MYGNAQSYTTPFGMLAERERQWELAEAAREARKEPDSGDWAELLLKIEFADSEKQADWLERFEDDSEESQSLLTEWISDKFDSIQRFLTKESRKAFSDFEEVFAV